MIKNWKKEIGEIYLLYILKNQLVFNMPRS